MTPIIHRMNPEDEYFFEEGCHILELSNTPDDSDVSIARARVPAGVTTRLHRLRGITERYVILQGAGLVEVNGAAVQPVGPGDVVVIPPLNAQRITSTGNAELVFLAVCSPRFVPGAYEDIEAPDAVC